ncbi:hypothetical protein CCHL11_07180 [Colletotrichum chlorophyti]|uniref:AA1-like domain-containing protein n=1 Tax=Colletotrichum chlorophyti TaxID=708187 RepID=A0A1Q8S0L5_9PEZI|nr:hypothetical protein CCHL11_07180 [Colletotrichum chlorophyti]
MRFYPILSATFVAAVPMTASSKDPEVIIANVSVKTLANYTLTYEFDVVDSLAGQVVHCTGEWDDVNRISSAVPCSVPSYNASIFFPNSVSSTQYWATFIGIEGRTAEYLATVQTGTSHYTCGHSGTEGVLSVCFTEPGYEIAATSV